MSDAPLTPVKFEGTVLGDEVFHAIGSAIVDGRLEPGAHLRDHEVARLLGVSRTPVREALQRLERTGLVEVVPHRYTRVSIPDDKLRDDTFEFAVLLLGTIVRVSVARIDDESLTVALAHVDRVIAASAADDHAGILSAGAALFETLTMATQNRIFVRLLREAELAILRNLAGRRAAIDSTADRTKGYVDFRDALAARDGRAAEAALRAVNGLA